MSTFNLSKLWPNKIYSLVEFLSMCKCSSVPSFTILLLYISLCFRLIFNNCPENLTPNLLSLSFSYLDLYRDPKEIKKEVLLERLKDIDPFDYSKTLKESKIPWEITNDKHEYPKWYWTTLFKRSHKLGPYRALRNPSAILPLNNNADLDYPKWPFAEKFRLPLTYPYKGGRKKALKYTKWVLPLKDHPHIREYDEDINQTRRDEMKEDLETVKSIQSESHQKSDKTIS